MSIGQVSVMQLPNSGHAWSTSGICWPSLAERCASVVSPGSPPNPLNLDHLKHVRSPTTWWPSRTLARKRLAKLLPAGRGAGQIRDKCSKNVRRGIFGLISGRWAPNVSKIGNAQFCSNLARGAQTSLPKCLCVHVSSIVASSLPRPVRRGAIWRSFARDARRAAGEHFFSHSCSRGEISIFRESKLPPNGNIMSTLPLVQSPTGAAQCKDVARAARWASRTNARKMLPARRGMGQNLEKCPINAHEGIFGAISGRRTPSQI